jgi:outer membrane receptor protein involved in Fe transport
MMNVSSAGTLLGSASILAFALLAPLTAVAQEAPAPDPTEQPQTTAPEPDEATEVSEVVVTGSRIGRTNLSSTSPVAVLGSEDIALDRALNIEEVLTELPQFSNGIGAVSTGSDARGATTLDLRGLGQNRTLVLVNGTRAVPFSFRNSVDVNAIPAPLIDARRGAPGGASAVYAGRRGAGVVNFILRERLRRLRGEPHLQRFPTRATRPTTGRTSRSGPTSPTGAATSPAIWASPGAKASSSRSATSAAPERNDAGVPNSTRPAGRPDHASDNASVFNSVGPCSRASPSRNRAPLTSTVQTSVFRPLRSPGAAAGANDRRALLQL